MEKCLCPMSDVAVQHIRSLAESYRLMVAAANDFNGIALANRRQIEEAICRAARMGDVIDAYLNGWECASPCLVYSCGWEFCRRNLEILNSIPNLPDIPIPANNTNNEWQEVQRDQDYQEYEQFQNQQSGSPQIPTP